jgi:hypothetical protein
VTRVRVFVLGALTSFVLVGLVAPMVRFLWNAWTHAGF